ncbi:NAD-binding Rossmann fold oxidoreductase family protein [Boeremia exigua]|uniref:NAD-binding Rossmann fold oxidoreductase family protein n=1 Tax=Boeremia exigua TaxID=749465 RepID=UPI001E8D0391|nr:NAD-binding Rossmann fold oxidoreductase family protein [Boeremia exigua]KAH6613147.1 NAD-binding Rossmann fold oxidoreductase family protein [Boeremia exigua]
MVPIGVGVIGLSSLTTSIPATAGDGWAASAHLPYLLASPLYEIVALCNSSIASAAKAVERYRLPPDTKTYGNPQDLADDPSVQLVVCCVRVDKHYELMMPVLRAGKDAYIEWPLGSNLQQAEEMLATAKKSGSRTIVGLQSRYSPATQKIKQLIAENAIGKLLSSSLSYDVEAIGDTDLPGVDYMSKKAAGGNMFTIMFAHCADAMFSALGGPEELSAILSTQWPEVRYLNADGSFNRMIERETPDHVLLQATLKASNVPVSIAVRGGKPFKNAPALMWRIFGTKGEIHLTSPTLVSLEFGNKLELYNYQRDTVEAIVLQHPSNLASLAPTAKNIGALYESFAVGKDVVGFDEAVVLHKLIEKIERSNEDRSRTL